MIPSNQEGRAPLSSWVVPGVPSVADLTQAENPAEVAAADAAAECMTEPALSGFGGLLLKGAAAAGRSALKFIAKHPLAAAVAASKIAKNRRSKSNGSQERQDEVDGGVPDSEHRQSSEFALPTGMRARATGDVFQLNPDMIELALQLGAVHAQRKDLAPLKELFFGGDPVRAAACRVPLYYLSDKGEWMPQTEYATQALSGGLLSSIKKIATKVAPKVAKIAKSVAKVAKFVPGIGTTVAAVADKVGDVANKVGSFGKTAIGKVGGLIGKLTGQGGSVDKEAAISAPSGGLAAASATAKTGRSATGSASAVKELTRWQGEVVPGALYGDAEEEGFEDLGSPADDIDDSEKLREVFTYVIPQGIAVAATNGIAPEPEVFSGAATLDSAAEDDLEAPAADETAAPQEAVAKQPAQSDDALDKIAEESVPKQDITTTDASGKVELTEDAQVAAQKLGPGGTNADPIYQRALDALDALAADVDSGKLAPLDSLALPSALTAGRAVSVGGRKTSLTVLQLREVLRKAMRLWASRPKKGVGPLLRAALGALALTALLRETSSEAKRKEYERVIQAVLSALARSVDEVRELDAIIENQKQGTATEAEARHLSDWLAKGLCLVEAVLQGRGFPRGKRVDPTLKLLSAYVADLVSSAVSAEDMKANGGVVRELLTKWRAGRDRAEKLAVDDRDLRPSREAAAYRSNAIAEARGEDVDASGDDDAMTAEEAITDSDRDLWEENRGFLKQAGALLDSQKLNTLLTALGFGAAVIPLLVSALGRDSKGEVGQKRSPAEEGQRRVNSILIGVEADKP